jgi:hypothetical protein
MFSFRLVSQSQFASTISESIPGSDFARALTIKCTPGTSRLVDGSVLNASGNASRQMAPTDQVRNPDSAACR